MNISSQNKFYLNKSIQPLELGKKNISFSMVIGTFDGYPWTQVRCVVRKLRTQLEQNIIFVLNFNVPISLYKIIPTR
jgi:hypothetical protein